MPKIFIIAGEASGDLHGSHLVRALNSLDSDLSIMAYGGPLMQKSGADVLRRYEDYAFMGFYEVLKHARKVLRNLSETQELVLAAKPDIIVFIDFPGFNLRVAKKLRSELPNCKFCYYISPKVWAWKTSRVHEIARLMDRVFVIFPFEEAFYKKFGYDVTYVGNPLMDQVDVEGASAKKKSLIAVLPGSRKQEIEMMLPVFAELSALMPELTFEVSVMPHFSLEFYDEHASEAGGNLRFSERTTYELLAEAEAALVTSGTATLETALFNTPQIVAYKTSRLSYEIGRRVIKTKYISLVNLILNKEAVKEVIQEGMIAGNLQAELTALLKDSSGILGHYSELRAILGESGASIRTAKEILS